VNSVPYRVWLQFLVRIPLGPETLCEEHRIGVLALRQIEGWLRENHRPRSLFDPHGRPKAELVSVSFDESQLEQAMAYRVFCNELGLSHSLRQSRIVHRNGART
jgi:hypothetical protein